MKSLIGFSLLICSTCIFSFPTNLETREGFSIQLMLTKHILYFVIVSGQFCQDLESKRIINGTEAKLGQFPYIMALRFIHYGFPQVTCTASIITQLSILCAGHCVVDDDTGITNPASYYDGILGTVRKDDAENRVTFKDIRVHPKYTFKPIKNDISILIVDKPIQWTEYIKPIALPMKGLSFSGQTVYSVGWGFYTFHDKVASDVLRYIETKVAITLICLVATMDNDHICTVQHKDQCTAEGDSGGPLVKKGSKMDVSLGVVSYGFSDTKCDKLPAAYTSTSVYHDWIKDNAEGEISYE